MKRVAFVLIASVLFLHGAVRGGELRPAEAADAQQTAKRYHLAVAGMT